MIACTKKCTAGVQIIWALFLLNQLMEYTTLVHEGKRPFTYSWLLILIALVGWMEPKYYQGMEVGMMNTCKGVTYQNIKVITDK